MARKRFSNAELDALFGNASPSSAAAPPDAKSPKPTRAGAIAEIHEIPAPTRPEAPMDPATPVEDGSEPRDPVEIAPAATIPFAAHAAGSAVLSLPITGIFPNPHQPRAEFDPAKLEEMANSIRERGILQPILVRAAGRAFQLVAGERRLRAAKLAGLSSVPALLVQLNDQELLEVALVENLQRDDLNPVEEARAYDYLCRQFGLTHEEVARRVGKDRTTVVNMLRLLRLPQAIKNDLQSRSLSTGHARALLALDSDEQMLDVHKEIVAKSLSVRQTEDRVRALLGERGPARRKLRSAAATDPHVEDIQARMTEVLGLRVRLRPKNSTSGRVEIAYSSLDDFERICDRLGIQLDA